MMDIYVVTILVAPAIAGLARSAGSGAVAFGVVALTMSVMTLIAPIWIRWNEWSMRYRRRIEPPRRRIQLVWIIPIVSTRRAYIAITTILAQGPS
jgi:hypothetical protein